MTPEYRRAVVNGVLVTLGFVALDVALGTEAAISGSYGIGAIVAGVLGGFRPSLIVGVFACTLAAASGIWNDDHGTVAFFARLFVAAAGSFVGAGAGRLRDEVVEQLGQQQLLSSMADLPEPGGSLQQTVRRVVDLLVPAHAEFAAIEGGLGEEPVRLAAGGTEPLETSTVRRTRLRARGREVGTLVTNRGRGGLDDPEFLRVLSGRIALALDNAGLSQELVTVEQQLQAILENLGEAVTVQDQTGRLVFANRAAAELLGAASVEELLSTPPMELVERFTTVNEDGSPLDVSRLPGREVLEGRRADPLVVRARNNATGEERWRVTKATPVHGPGGEVLLAVNVIEDITESKRAELTQRLLADASAALASSIDYRQTLQSVARLPVPDLADGCVISFPRPAGLEQIASAGSALARDDEAAQVMRTGKPITHSSVLVVPLATADRTVGVMTLDRSESGRKFIYADLELAVELGRRIAIAVENARLHSELENVATTLQRSLLPPALPEVPGWKMEALYMPAGGETDVGGDFYDVFPTAAGWMAVMGDVVGRGPAAASLTAMGRYTLRTAGSLVGTPTMALARLNDNLRERGEMALCTVAVILLRAGSDEATLVCAGHPLPYLLRDGEVRAVGRTGPLLGAFEQGSWLPATLELLPGDVIVLYTDGVTDARGDNGRFGESGLEAALAEARSAEEAVERVRAAMQSFGGGEHDDDTAVLALQKL